MNDDLTTELPQPRSWYRCPKFWRLMSLPILLLSAFFVQFIPEIAEALSDGHSPLEITNDFFLELYCIEIIDLPIFLFLGFILAPALHVASIFESVIPNYVALISIMITYWLIILCLYSTYVHKPRRSRFAVLAVILFSSMYGSLEALGLLFE